MQYLAESRPITISQPNKKILATDILIGCTLFFVLFRGFIENFLGQGTLYVDFCFGILLLWSLFKCIRGKLFQFYRGKALSGYLKLYLIWVVLCTLVCLCQALTGRTGAYDAVIQLRNNCIYTGLFFICAMTLDRRSISSFYNFFINCGVFICAFAIVQYLFRDFLPDSFLFLNDEGNFGFYGEDAIRVTGLMGNTIIFSGFTIILFALVWAEIISGRYKINALWIKLIFIATANFLTFSRASIVGMVAVFVFEIFLYGVTHGNAAKSILLIVFLLFAAIFLMFTVFRNTIIVKRLIDSDSLWNSGSDAGHLVMIQEAIDAIKENWLLGQNNKIITDGAIWAYMLEMGIPVFLVYCVVVFVFVLFAIKHCKSRNKMICNLSLGYVGMYAYFLVSSLINSAYAARSVLVFVWFIGGMMFAAAANEKYLSEKRK